MLLSGRSSSFLWFGLGFWSFIGSLGLMVSWKLWAVIRAAQGCQMSANRFLRGIIWGGLCHLEVLSVFQLCRVLSALRARGLRWDATPARGSALSALMGWFRSRMYSLLSPWKWSLGSSVTEVCLNGSMPPQVWAHKIRQGWRLLLYRKCRVVGMPVLRWWWTIVFLLPLTGIGFVRIAPLTRLCATWLLGPRFHLRL